MGFEAMHEYTEAQIGLGQRRRPDPALLQAVAAGRVPGQDSRVKIAPFTFESLPSRVVFGAGALARVPDELDRLGWKRALVLVTPQRRGQGEELAASLGSRAAGLFAEARPHVPVNMVMRARAAATAAGADCTVSVGGGSTVGLGKALSLDPGLPQLAIATTYAGSEMTPIWGITEGGVKQTGRDRARAAQGRGLRPALDARAAGPGHRGQRHERDRPLRRGAVLGRRKSDDQPERRGGHPGAGGRRAAPRWCA